MYAILSDIHGNLAALQAVLADAAEHGVTDVYCLGDIVGYGPNPLECIDAVRGCKVGILGNHDQAALFDPESFNASARRAIMWTRAQLEAPTQPPDDRERRWGFLSELPLKVQEGDSQFVHGSLLSPLFDYVFPEDVHKAPKMRRLFALVAQYCFQGHTHWPGIFTPEPRFMRPESFGYTYELGAEKAIVNVGSVGQPRDGDWRASYVLRDGPMLYFRRIEYDIEATIQQIYATPELDNFLGDRLRDGR
jgi:diadenosine tetraphosphatase ApaH/serine/threonine PP2A family protein phosphatase